MNTKLWSVRLKSFGISAATIIGGGLLTSIVSPEFISLVQEYTQGTIWGTLAVLIIPEVVKDIRNRFVLGKASRRFGADVIEEIELI